MATAPGETVTCDDFSVKFVGVRPIAGPNYTAVEGTLIATTSSGHSFTGPKARTFPGLMGGAPAETNEAALLTRPGGQLYAVLGQPVTGADGRADLHQLRLWWKPLVWWIWLGGALIAIGVALSLLGRAQLLTLWRSHRAQGEEALRMKTRWILFMPVAITALLFRAFIYRLTTRRNADPVAVDQQADAAVRHAAPATAGVEGLKSGDLADGRPRSSASLPAGASRAAPRRHGSGAEGRGRADRRHRDPRPARRCGAIPAGKWQSLRPHPGRMCKAASRSRSARRASPKPF